MIAIPPSDLKIETIPNRRSRGMSASIIPTGVMATHLPTGIIVQCRHLRTQKKNRDAAIAMIRTGIECVD